MNKLFDLFNYSNTVFQWEGSELQRSNASLNYIYIYTSHRSFQNNIYPLSRLFNISDVVLVHVAAWTD